MQKNKIKNYDWTLSVLLEVVKLTENKVNKVIRVKNVNRLDIQGTASLQELNSLSDGADAWLEEMPEATALHVVHEDCSIARSIFKSSRLCWSESVAWLRKWKVVQSLPAVIMKVLIDESKIYFFAS